MKNKILFFVGLAFVLIGISLFAYSLTQDRYTDVKTYNEKYLSIDSSASDAIGQFSALRDEYLTSKFSFEDYGLSFLLFGAIIMIVNTIGYKQLRTPGKRVWLILTGLCASVLVCMAYVGELFLRLFREVYPHWADSLGIPLMSTPIILLIFLIWTGILLIWIRDPFVSGVGLFPLNIRKSDKFLLIVLLLTAIIMLYALMTGDFWMIIPGAFWMYFYLSIIQGKSEAKSLKEN